MNATRVVIADDQVLVRTGFRMILMSEGIDVVGEAANGDEALRVVRATRPDVVLMDIRMPGMDGLEATRLILSESAGGAAASGSGSSSSSGSAEPAPEPPRIIILTTFDLDQYVYAAITAGASGFLLKDVSPEHLVAAVGMVRAGDAMLAPAITRRLVERFAVPTVNPRTEALHKDLATLTPREREVLGLLGRGLSNAELAARFHLSEATVKTHVARILAKLNLRDRAQAVVVAYETGLITPGVA
ncbi:response regulator [Catenulispora rubra]|uniref:response regulator n=1 Tax=Catenulispora rubra TaxID=280293 RepID=UPI0018927F3B|nr:response regulator transcription factor [Catenulispora rubra]